jgi:hypothetical protein
MWREEFRSRHTHVHSDVLRSCGGGGTPPAQPARRRRSALRDARAHYPLSVDAIAAEARSSWCFAAGSRGRSWRGSFCHCPCRRSWRSLRSSPAVLPRIRRDLRGDTSLAVILAARDDADGHAAVSPPARAAGEPLAGIEGRRRAVRGRRRGVTYRRRDVEALFGDVGRYLLTGCATSPMPRMI